MDNKGRVIIVDVNSLYPHIIISHNISADTLFGYIAGEENEQLKKFLNLDEKDDFYQKFAPGRTAGRLFGLLYAFKEFDLIRLNNWKIQTAYHTEYLNGDDLLKYIKEKQLIVTINGALFKSSPLGIWPAIEKELLEKRQIYKKQNDNTKQLAYKILANSLYGVYAAPNFIAFNPYIAEAITITGQFIILSLSMFVNQKILNKDYKIDLQDFRNSYKEYNGKDQFILYRDTDSMFIYDIINYDYEPYIAEVGRFLLENTTLQSLEPETREFYLNYSPKVKLEFVGDSSIFVGAKKRYFIYDSKNDKYKLAGFLNNAYPQVLNNLILTTLKNIALGKLNKTNKKHFLNKIKQTINNFIQEEILNDLYQTVSWNSDNIEIRKLDDLNNYSNIDAVLKSIPPHIFSMIVYNTIIDKELFGLYSKALSLKANFKLDKLAPLIKSKVKDISKFNYIMKKIGNSNIIAFESFDIIKPYIQEDSISELLYERIEKFLEERILFILE